MAVFENAPRSALKDLVATTRTPAITVLADGRRFIEKRCLGARIGLRVGAEAEEQAEERRRTEMARVESSLQRWRSRCIAEPAVL